MNAVAYVRVSSKAQKLATQKAAITREAAARGDLITDWREEKMSGKKLARPVLDALRNDVEQGRVSRVYVFKLDRITRSGVADTFKVVEAFRAAGCTLIAVSDNLTIRPEKDAHDIAAETMIFALSLAARIELAAKNERIAAARDRVEAAGGRWGRPSVLTSKDRERIAALRAQHLTVRAIAVKLKIARSTVADALKAAAA
jgi:DNA invertase Pin-like site-specific DNA recombinase